MIATGEVISGDKELMKLHNKAMKLKANGSIGSRVAFTSRWNFTLVQYYLNEWIYLFRKMICAAPRANRFLGFISIFCVSRPRRWTRSSTCKQKPSIVDSPGDENHPQSSNLNLIKISHSAECKHKSRRALSSNKKRRRRSGAVFVISFTRGCCCNNIDGEAIVEREPSDELISLRINRAKTETRDGREQEEGRET